MPTSKLSNFISKEAKWKQMLEANCTEMAIQALFIVAEIGKHLNIQQQRIIQIIVNLYNALE